MNPEITEEWDKALKAFNVAKTAFKNDKSRSDILVKLREAILYGQFMAKKLKSDGQESLIGAGTAVESYFQLGQIGTRQAFDKVLQSLKEYRNLVPDGDELPLPTGLDK